MIDHTTHYEALTAATVDLQNLTHQLLAHQRRHQSTPAAMEVVVLTADRPTWTSDVGEGLEALSLGIFNPTGIVVRLGVGGTSASARGRGIPVAPKTLLVLPVDVRDMEVGADNPADLAAGDAVIYLLRFMTVQPAFLGASG